MALSRARDDPCSCPCLVHVLYGGTTELGVFPAGSVRNMKDWLEVRLGCQTYSNGCLCKQTVPVPARYLRTSVLQAKHPERSLPNRQRTVGTATTRTKATLSTTTTFLHPCESRSCPSGTHVVDFPAAPPGYQYIWNSGIARRVIPRLSQNQITIYLTRPKRATPDQC